VKSDAGVKEMLGEEKERWGKEVEYRGRLKTKPTNMTMSTRGRNLNNTRRFEAGRGDRGEKRVLNLKKKGKKLK